ncbi:MAG: DNA mismatch repair endonuclease MutL [Oscillospiraceae bacterium]|nr:DNA mismatch repair endonuclease MutL [Oscillospiraceae bacterium]
MSKINVLPKGVAELIAAGEVVERPASVIKELTENSIDALATEITVEIKNGGIKYMRVTDNGSGIDISDVPVAFLTHATSKIKNADDLNAIFTLGFRGEALPSIAAVSKVFLLSKTADAEEGVAYTVEGGEGKSNEPAGCPNGTTVIVRDIFYNIPARMKFLKKDVTEGNYISDIVTKIALSRPDIKFTFIRDEKRVFTTPGNGDLFAALYSVFGREVTDMLFPCSYEYEKIKVSGFVSKPLGNRPNRNMQYFFVNGRYVRIPAAAPALDRAYKNSIMVGKFPMCFLRLELPGELTDVNVHPAKTEIRFSDESKVFETVFYAAKAAIAKGDTLRPEVTLQGKKSILDESENAVHEQLAFGSEPAFRRGFSEPQKKEQISVSDMPLTRSFIEPPKKYTANAPKIDIVFSDDDKAPVDFLELHDSAGKGEVKPPERDFAKEFSLLSKNAPEKKDTQEKVRVIGEAFKTYIIAERGNKLILIDKHAAHERMIFNSLGDDFSSGEAQMLLSPAVVGLSGREYAAVIDNIGVFTKIGYEIEDFGSSSVIVRACPVLLEKDDVSSIIREMAGKLVKGDMQPVPEKLDWLKNSTACRAAVKAGDSMSLTEMQSFAEKLLSDESVKYCPHGRPVLYELSKYELEKQFGRLE